MCFCCFSLINSLKLNNKPPQTKKLIKCAKKAIGNSKTKSKKKPPITFFFIEKVFDLFFGLQCFYLLLFFCFTRLCATPEMRRRSDGIKTSLWTRTRWHSSRNDCASLLMCNVWGKSVMSSVTRFISAHRWVLKDNAIISESISPLPDSLAHSNYSTIFILIFYLHFSLSPCFVQDFPALSCSQGHSSEHLSVLANHFLFSARKILPYSRCSSLQPLSSKYLFNPWMFSTFFIKIICFNLVILSTHLSATVFHFFTLSYQIYHFRLQLFYALFSLMIGLLVLFHNFCYVNKLFFPLLLL